MSIPKMLRVRQKFPASPSLNIPAALAEQVAARKILSGIKSGARIAVTAGSRGVANVALIVGTIVKLLKEAGAAPFVLPAMGSHGGSTPEGQAGILADYGITEKTMGAPIRASMETKIVGATPDGVPVHCSVEALNSDGVIVVNRIKPHTDFHGGRIASGVMKMMAIGLGKRNGAECCHAAASRLGYERVMLSVGRVNLERAPILCGVGAVEDQRHQTAIVKAMPRDVLEEEESQLLKEARARMPKLPFDDVDLLIVDRIGKNISGTGMDTNIINRGVQGYTSSLVPGDMKPPIIRRLLVRGLTEKTHGNAVGIGLADFCTTRTVEAMDRNISYINSITALTPQPCKIPIYFDTDRECIEKALATLALPPGTLAKCIRIGDTLSLEEVLVSEAYANQIKGRADLEALSAAAEMTFDVEGNLYS